MAALNGTDTTTARLRCCAPDKMINGAMGQFGIHRKGNSDLLRDTKERDSEPLLKCFECGAGAVWRSGCPIWRNV